MTITFNIGDVYLSRVNSEWVYVRIVSVSPLTFEITHFAQPTVTPEVTNLVVG